ncbi:MAG: ECF transporter S component [Janthinobacterium lividum]
MSTTSRTSAPSTRRTVRWRSVDLLTAAVLGVAFGVVFWGWDVLYLAVQPVFTALPPLSGILGGVWLLPAVVGALIIRRPGAALLAEMVAASVEALLGNYWGAGVLVSGVIQALGVELVVATFRWRRWGVPVAVLAGMLAAALEGVYEMFVNYADTWATGYRLVYIGAFVVSGAVIAGVGGRAIVRGLARSGALSAFAVGRERPRG